MAPALKSRGAEVLARRPGRCRLCPDPIRPGQPVLKVGALGWTHATCGDSYRAVLAAHSETEGER